MLTAREIVDQAWRRGIRPAPQRTVSQWADRFRMLPSTSAEPGRWDTRRTPYLREIMDALSAASPIERVVFMKGAQLGGTEAGLNWLGYVIADAPGVLLLVMPSLDAIRRNTRLRIDPLIDATPEIRMRVVPARSRDPGNTASEKAFPGGRLVMTGANSAAGLRSTPARYLFLDEVDGFPLSADEEGDPVALAIQRTATFRGRAKVFMVSTPTVAGVSRIAQAYEESDQRRYLVPCPHCGERRSLEWANMRWPEAAPRRAYMFCPDCGGIIEERHKPAMLAAGAWQAFAVGDGRTAGFHLSTLYSPFEPWGEVALDYTAAQRDSFRLQVWTNTKLGLPWEDQAGDTIDAEGLAARVEDWGELVPPGVAVLTAGVDTQGDRIEVQVIGWGAGEEAWILDYRILYGDPSGPAIWLQLDEYLRRTWRHARDLPDLAIRAAAIDSGGHYTGKVYDFAATRHARRIWAVKGANAKAVPVWPRRPSKGKHRAAPVYLVGVDAAKDILAARLKVASQGPGFVHFNKAACDQKYFDQLTAEKVVTQVVRGRPVRSWQLRIAGARNEALDTAVYAYAALAGLSSLGLMLDREAKALIDRPIRADDVAERRSAGRPAAVASPFVARW